ncbi:hypothetical protein [Longimicrobium sp.]|uniref:hypothetical protein n=1 Tax=Longimicrobium sp. TaxID=2029185 RepID=UPI003B3AADF8
MSHGPREHGSAAEPLAARLRFRVAPDYPGFDRTRMLSLAVGNTGKVYAFAEEDCREWYRRFVDEVLAAVAERRYLPVYRMADGEYSFVLGPAEEQLPLRRLRPRQLARRVLNRVLGRRGGHRSGSHGYGWEVYTPRERRALLDAYAADLRLVADRGYLALAMGDSGLSDPWMPGILDWLDARGVRLHAGNYQHMYAVYALMNGPDRERLLRGRRVLVVNHADAARQAAIGDALATAGAVGARFISISREKAMLERLDPRALRDPVDLVLVGAGVGAANVLRQLEPLGVPALDVGFALDIMAQPELRWRRPFCVPDDEFDPARVEFLSPEKLALLGARRRRGDDAHPRDQSS